MVASTVWYHRFVHGKCPFIYIWHEIAKAPSNWLATKISRAASFVSQTVCDCHPMMEAPGPFIQVFWSGVRLHVCFELPSSSHCLGWGAKTRSNERFHTRTLQQLRNVIKSGRLILCGILREWKRASSQDRRWTAEVEGLVNTDWKVHTHSFLILCLA